MSDRRATWLRLQADYPETAQWLTDMAGAFGKPAFVEVVDTATGEIVVDTGRRYYQREERRPTGLRKG